jgi:hypothetical protein
MSIYHKHHIIPKHMGGTDHPSNLVELTIEEHAEAHRKLFEEHGRWQDEIAWKTLSGQISNAEAIKMAQSFSNKGKKLSKETKEKLSKSKFGKKDSVETRKIKSESSGVKGKKYYNDGLIENRFFEGQQPKNWKLGRLHGKVPNSRDKVWCNNGFTDTICEKNSIPVGWVVGRLHGTNNCIRDMTGKFTKRKQQK